MVKSYLVTSPFLIHQRVPKDPSPPGKKSQNITGLPLGSKEPHQVESHGTH